MKLDRDTWLQVEPLLATALELAPEARGPWLQALEATHPGEAPLLRRLLAAHERAELARSLETVPRLAPPPAWTSGHAAGERVGAFVLERLLGHGGMGEVWLARQDDGRLDREVALKLPTPMHDGPSWRERFRREGDILARLEHAHIARLYDAGVTPGGQPWMAMEYVEGRTLSEVMAEAAPDVPGRLALFRQVLAAVAHAHRHLVVHRDLKPTNILVDAQGGVKLLDFGIARLVDDGEAGGADLTRLGARPMTLRYAAPEQALGGEISTATDIYSLGVILHEMLTGHSPYPAVREGRALREAHLEEPVATLPSHLPMPGAQARRIAGDLDAIVLKALRRAPAERYASVERFDEDLAAHLDHRPVLARPGTFRYVASRFVARHRGPIASAALLLVALGVGVFSVDRERRVAVAERARAEKHLASVRKLANDLIFTVHDQIEDLPGSLKARESIVKTGLQYLDSLAAEAGDDPKLKLEVAAGYRRIGNIQGQPGGANIGDLAASRASFERAQAIHRQLAGLDPPDIAAMREHTSLSFALARSYFVGGDARWRAEIAQTVKLAERTASLPGATPRDRARVPGSLAEQAHLAMIADGDLAAASSAIEQALALLEAMARDAPQEVPVKLNLISTYQRAADIYDGARRTPQTLKRSIELREKAIALLDGLVGPGDTEVRYRHLRQENLVALAGALRMSGEVAAGEEVILRVLEENARLVAADRGNMESVMGRIQALSEAAHIARTRGDLDLALARAREGVKAVAGLTADVRASRDARNYIADARYQLGRALLAKAEAPRTAGRRREWLLEAKDELVAAVAFIAQARAEKLGFIPEEEAGEREAALARCEALLAGA